MKWPTLSRIVPVLIAVLLHYSAVEATASELVIDGELVSPGLLEAFGPMLTNYREYCPPVSDTHVRDKYIQMILQARQFEKNEKDKLVNTLAPYRLKTKQLQTLMEKQHAYRFALRDSISEADIKRRYAQLIEQADERLVDVYMLKHETIELPFYDAALFNKLRSLFEKNASKEELSTAIGNLSSDEMVDPHWTQFSPLHLNGFEPSELQGGEIIGPFKDTPY